MHAERWNWVVVTRKPGELKTYADYLPTFTFTSRHRRHRLLHRLRHHSTRYVNGRLCAAVKLEAAKETKASCLPSPPSHPPHPPHPFATHGHCASPLTSLISRDLPS